MKVSAVAPEHQIVEAPAVVFQDQQDLADAFKAGQLEKDFVAVMRFQGPRSNGMPELHKMTPFLGVLQDRGFKVALVTARGSNAVPGPATTQNARWFHRYHRPAQASLKRLQGRGKGGAPTACLNCTR